ncbi:MAG: hypothetical protein AB8B69_08590 [Chitinophagales bacterium]
MKYSIKRTCKDCNHRDVYPVTKIEAAFEGSNSSKVWKMSCSKCGSKNCSGVSYSTVSIDKELLDIWGKNPKLFFLSQDEELILAEIDYLPMILKAIDENNYLKGKIEVLIEAICVLLYDNTANREEYSKEGNESREQIAAMIRPELIKRKEKVFAARKRIWGYVKKIVFPQIGL